MAELHTSGIYGNYEPNLAQLFNPAVGGQFNPGVFGPIGSGATSAAYGNLGAGAVPYAAFAQQNPWTAQYHTPLNTPSQQLALHPAQYPVQSAVQAAQQIAARQAMHAIQCAQALQQIVQYLVTQQFAQPTMGWQPNIGQGMGGAFAAGQTIPQPYGWVAQTLNPVPQQQAMTQLAPYLAAQQAEQFRQGWVH